SAFTHTTATTEIYTLSLHDALPICEAEDFADEIGCHTEMPTIEQRIQHRRHGGELALTLAADENAEHTDGRQTELERDRAAGSRSEEHTSELQSRGHLVCRLLLEKK